MGTDLSEFYIAKDENYYYLMMKLYDGPPHENTVYVFHANQSSTVSDTPGDRYTHFSIPNGESVVTVYERVEGDETPFSDFYYEGYSATGSDFVEWKVPKTSMGSVNGKFIRVYTHYVLNDFTTISDHNQTDIQLIDSE